MKKTFEQLLSISGYLVVGLISFKLYHSLYTNHHFWAIIQWPVLISMYTIYVFMISKGSLNLLKSFYFIAYFTAIAMVSYSACLLVGYSGFLVGILGSGLCS